MTFLAFSSFDSLTHISSLLLHRLLDNNLTPYDFTTITKRTTYVHQYADSTKNDRELRFNPLIFILSPLKLKELANGPWAMPTLQYTNTFSDVEYEIPDKKDLLPQELFTVLEQDNASWRKTLICNMPTRIRFDLGVSSEEGHERMLPFALEGNFTLEKADGCFCEEP